MQAGSWSLHCWRRGREAALALFATLTLGGAASAAEVEVTAFGARCDGATNDQAAFEAAVAHLEQAGGGILRLPAATCVHERTIQLRSNVSLMGQGWDASVLQRTKSGVSSLRAHGKRGARISNVLIADLKIVGVTGYERGYRKGSHAVEIQHADSVTVRNVWAQRIGGEAFYAQGDDNRRIAFLFNRATDIGHNAYNFNGRPLESRVVGNYASDIWANGLEAAGADLEVADNVFERYRLWGVIIGNLYAEGRMTERVRVERNVLRHSRGKPSESGGMLFAAGGRDVHIANNTIHDNAGFGIYINGTTKIGKFKVELPGDLVIENNTIHDNGDGVRNTAGIHIRGSPPNIVIRRNRLFSSRERGRSQRVGVRVAKGNATISIVDNLAYDHGEANYVIGTNGNAGTPAFRQNKSGYGNQLRVVDGRGRSFKF